MSGSRIINCRKPLINEAAANFTVRTFAFPLVNRNAPFRLIGAFGLRFRFVAEKFAALNI